MSERKYSVVEIEHMRNSLTLLLTPMNRPFMPNEIATQIEEQLRTYMQNGTEPGELGKRAAEHMLAMQEMQTRFHRPEK